MSDAADRVLGQLVRSELAALYLLLDAQDRVVEANRHGRDVLGDQVVGRRLAELLVVSEQGVSPTELARGEPVRRDLNLVSSQRLPQTYDCWFVRVDGGTAVLGGVAPGPEERLRRELLDANLRLAAGTRELQQANAQLARLGRLKDLFLGMAAHDLRSPLASVQARVGVLVEELGPTLPPDGCEDLEAIQGALALMRRLVEDFLDVALIEAGQLRLKPVQGPLLPLARRALALSAAEPARARVSVRVEGDAAAAAFVDPARVEQLLINLVNNAAQHTAAGGEVVVSVWGEDRVTVLTVSDQGEGIPAEIQANLFAAFTNGPAGDGPRERSIGLGLTISRMIVQAHGGAIALRSEPGRGTTVEVRLPAERRHV